MDGSEIDGRRIAVGTVADLMHERAERKAGDKFGIVKAGATGGGPDRKDGMGLGSGFLKRPLQGPRRGGKGGLGLKWSGAGLGGPRAGLAVATAAGPQPTNGSAAQKADNGDEAKQNATTDGAHELVDGTTNVAASKTKTNADFKALFLKS